MATQRQNGGKNARIFYRRCEYDDTSVPTQKVFDSRKYFQIALRIRAQTVQYLFGQIDCRGQFLDIGSAQIEPGVGFQGVEHRTREVFLVDQEGNRIFVALDFERYLAAVEIARKLAVFFYIRPASPRSGGGALEGRCADACCTRPSGLRRRSARSPGVPRR